MAPERLELRHFLLLGILPPILAVGAGAAWWMFSLGAPPGTLALPPLLGVAFGGALAARLARRIARSLAELEQRAIGMAGGEPEASGSLRAAPELREIDTALNREADEWRQRTDAVEMENLALENAARSRELLDQFGREQHVKTVAALHAEWLPDGPGYPDASGYVVAPGGAHLVAWLAKPSEGELIDHLRLRREIELLCRRLLDRHPDTPAALLPLLRPIYPRDVAAFVVIDSLRRQMDSIARVPVTLLIAGTGAPGREVTLASERSIQVDGGGFAILSSSGDPAHSVAASAVLRDRVAARVEARPAGGGAAGLVIGLTPGAPSPHLPFPAMRR